MKKMLFAAFAALLAAGCRTNPDEDPATTKVLMIGNSFSISCMRYLPAVALDLGEELDVTSLYIGGCSLERHWGNATTNVLAKPYRMDRDVRGKRIADGRKTNVLDELMARKYDIVTVQQASHESWRPASYACGDKLVAKIRELQPQAKIVVQETWSYTPWDKRLAKWQLTPDTMYAKLAEAYAGFARRNGLEVIRMGRAIQEWRRRLPVKYTDHSFGGDVVGGRFQPAADQFKRTPESKWVPNCDVFHLNERGEFFQALVWAAKLFPKADVKACNVVPEGVSEDDAKLMREIAAGVNNKE